MSCFESEEAKALKAQARQNEIIEQQLKKDRDVYGNTHRLLVLGELLAFLLYSYSLGLLTVYTCRSLVNYETSHSYIAIMYI